MRPIGKHKIHSWVLSTTFMTFLSLEVFCHKSKCFETSLSFSLSLWVLLWVWVKTRISSFQTYNGNQCYQCYGLHSYGTLFNTKIKIFLPFLLFFSFDDRSPVLFACVKTMSMAMALVINAMSTRLDMGSAFAMTLHLNKNFLFLLNSLQTWL